MKFQDQIFVIFTIYLLIRRDFRIFAVMATVFLILAILLFADWIFFTAIHLTWYSGLYILITVLYQIYRLRSLTLKKI